MLRERDREACFCPATPALDARSITALAVATVKLCKVAAPKESQPAATSQERGPHAAGCDSFGAATLQSLTVATAKAVIDLASGAGVAGQKQASRSRLFNTATRATTGRISTGRKGHF